MLPQADTTSKRRYHDFQQMREPQPRGFCIFHPVHLCMLFFIILACTWLMYVFDIPDNVIYPLWFHATCKKLSYTFGACNVGCENLTFQSCSFIFFSTLKHFLIKRCKIQGLWEEKKTGLCWFHTMLNFVLCNRPEGCYKVIDRDLMPGWPSDDMFLVSTSRSTWI